MTDLRTGVGMSDRELLEAAAKAAGGRVSFDYSPDGYPWLQAVVDGKPQPYPVRWNPLTDDGDALRLAVKLSLLIAPIPYQPGINAYGAVGVSWPGQRFDLDYERFTNDPYAATRRAIVRAAAAIGRSKDE